MLVELPHPARRQVAIRVVRIALGPGDPPPPLLHDAQQPLRVGLIPLAMEPRSAIPPLASLAGKHPPGVVQLQLDEVLHAAGMAEVALVVVLHAQRISKAAGFLLFDSICDVPGRPPGLEIPRAGQCGVDVDVSLLRRLGLLYLFLHQLYHPNFDVFLIVDLLAVSAEVWIWRLSIGRRCSTCVSCGVEI